MVDSKAKARREAGKGRDRRGRPPKRDAETVAVERERKANKLRKKQQQALPEPASCKASAVEKAVVARPPARLAAFFAKTIIKLVTRKMKRIINVGVESDAQLRAPPATPIPGTIVIPSESCVLGRKKKQRCSPSRDESGPPPAKEEKSLEEGEESRGDLKEFGGVNQDDVIRQLPLALDVISQSLQLRPKKEEMEKWQEAFDTIQELYKHFHQASGTEIEAPSHGNSESDLESDFLMSPPTKSDWDSFVEGNGWVVNNMMDMMAKKICTRCPENTVIGFIPSMFLSEVLMDPESNIESLETRIRLLLSKQDGKRGMKLIISLAIVGHHYHLIIVNFDSLEIRLYDPKRPGTLLPSISEKSKRQGPQIQDCLQIFKTCLIAATGEGAWTFVNEQGKIKVFESDEIPVQRDKSSCGPLCLAYLLLTVGFEMDGDVRESFLDALRKTNGRNNSLRIFFLSLLWN